MRRTFFSLLTSSKRSQSSRRPLRPARMLFFDIRRSTSRTTWCWSSSPTNQTASSIWRSSGSSLRARLCRFYVATANLVGLCKRSFAMGLIVRSWLIDSMETWSSCATPLDAPEGPAFGLTSDPSGAILMSDADPRRQRPANNLAPGHLRLAHTAHSRPRAQHGQGIARSIQRQSEDVFLVDHGSLYLALQRLEECGLVAAKWGVSDNNRRARFYKLTAKGRAASRTNRGVAEDRRSDGAHFGETGA